MSVVDKFKPSYPEACWFAKSKIESRLKMAQKVDEGKELWWRQEEYFGYKGTPKWHLFTDRKLVNKEVSESLTVISTEYSAMCGHTKVFSEMLAGEEPNLRITRPKVDDRCVDCSIKFNELEKAIKLVTTAVTDGSLQAMPKPMVDEFIKVVLQSEGYEDGDEEG